MQRKNEVEVGAGVRAAVGFALGDDASGIAYAAIGAGLAQSVIRVPFRCKALPALNGRDVDYAAMIAVSEELRRRGFHRVSFELESETLVRDLGEHRPVPGALSIPYVMLGCALNRFAEASLVESHGTTCRDLTARARAEVSLHVAA